MKAKKESNFIAEEVKKLEILIKKYKRGKKNSLDRGEIVVIPLVSGRPDNRVESKIKEIHKLKGEKVEFFSEPRKMYFSGERQNVLCVWLQVSLCK